VTAAPSLSTHHGLYVGTKEQIEEWPTWPGSVGRKPGDFLDIDAFLDEGVQPPQPFGEYPWIDFWYADEESKTRAAAARWTAATSSKTAASIVQFPIAEVRKIEAWGEELAATSASTRTPAEIRRDYDVGERLEWLEVDRIAREKQAAILAERHRENWDELFLDESELSTLVVPPALIEGVLPCGSNAILRGRDGTYKTFAALDWVLHIATGRPWNGHVCDPGAVLYIAGEGAFGIKDRVAAWREHHKITGPLPFTLRRSALNMAAPGEAFEHLLAWVEGHKIRLVVIDTLRRVSGGAEENSSAMGAVVDSIERIKAAMAEVGGSTVTITHTGKDDKDTRGFSGIEDDIDVVWHAKREEGTPFMTLLHRKMKDGVELPPVTLMAEPTGESLVLTAAAGAAGASTEARILTFLNYETDEKDEGETAAVIISKTGLPKRTVIDALGRMLTAGDLVLTRPTRPKKYASTASLVKYMRGAT